MLKKSINYAIFILFIIYVFSTPLAGQSIFLKFLEKAQAPQSNDKIAVSIGFSPFVPVTGLPVKFFSKTSVSPELWQWEFGDGELSYESSPSHIYTTAGTYKVKLTIRYNGLSASATKKVRVYAAKTDSTSSDTRTSELIPSFDFAPVNPESGMTVQFTDTSSGRPTSWAWDFGDGNKSTTQNPQHQFVNSGTYNVSLTVSDGTVSKSLAKSITVVPVLTVDFNYSPAVPETGQAIQFQDLSSGNPSSWSWNFGDGTTSSLKNPTHAYASPGNYTVTLQVSNAYYTKSLAKNITVVAPLSVDFTFSPPSPIVGQDVQFTNTSSGSFESYLWNFGDGSTSTLKDPVHKYSSAGVFTVTLTGTSVKGSNSKSQTITVSQSLGVSFTFSPSSPYAGQMVQFTDTSSGTPTSWQWDFGDGGTSTQQNPQHQYQSAGTFNVTLTASNGTSSNSFTKPIVVLPALSAGFSYSPANPEAGENIQFQDTSTGNPSSWSWNFGDGSTSSTQNPIHSYSTAGTYNVTLQVSNGTYTNSISKNITVLSAVAVDFTFSPSAPLVNQDVQFTNQTSGSVDSYLWNFGDGSTSTLKDPIHKFASAGSFTVTLTATSTKGSKSNSKTVVVSQSLNPSFSYSPSSPYAGQMVQFTDTSSGTPTSWQWDFGDGATSNLKNPTHTYLAAGSFTVMLTVSNGYESKTTTKTLVVNPVVQADFTFSPTNPNAGTSVQFTDKSTGNITSWSWNFGDGTTSTQKNPVHAYSTAGSYNVTLTVSDGTTSNSMTQTISVKATIVADFSYSPSSPVVGQEVQFLDNSQGTPTSWSWDFGDGAKGTVKNPTHTYSQAGTYTVKLTVSDGTNSSTKNTSLTVLASSKGVITSASCELADVKAAIAQAKAGDTVVVPAGSATWNSNLVINKGIILKGMGVDKTVITCNYDGTGESMNSGGYFISYEPGSPAEDQPFRLTGFTFNLNSKSNTGGLLLKNKSNYYQTKVRIDHTKWVGVNAKRAIWWIYGYFWGVGDNNYFDTPGNFRFYGLDSTTWANETFNYGTANNFYLEDNYFRLTNDDYFYLEGAGRLALRYNTIYCDVRTGGYYPVVDVHGNQASAWSGAMGFEGYGNQIYASYSMRVIDGRAGRILFYNNSITQSSGSSSIAMREEEYDSNNPPAQAPDGQPQHVSDSYVFNNYRNGTLLTLDFPYTGSQLYYSAEGCNVPTEGIHYWKHNSSFDGTSGVGVGLLSKRPSSGSKDGVAWWATDVNNLYRWKNGKWELYYTPFAYPHPLRDLLTD